MCMDHERTLQRTAASKNTGGRGGGQALFSRPQEVRWQSVECALVQRIISSAHQHEVFGWLCIIHSKSINKPKLNYHSAC